MRKPQRRRIFVGCEGESEVGYATLIARLLDERHHRFYLDPVNLCGGDPLSIIMAAKRQLLRRGSRDAPYEGRVIFLDADRRDDVPARRDQTLKLAKQLKIGLIWQEPCHEALLLRHLPGCELKKPSSKNLAERALQREWQDYEKPLTWARLATRIDRDGVLRAAAVEKALREFLTLIKFD